jgi:hypothetical protein
MDAGAVLGLWRLRQHADDLSQFLDLRALDDDAGPLSEDLRLQIVSLPR